jgi:hypothetical protein
LAGWATLRKPLGRLGRFMGCAGTGREASWAARKKENSEEDELGWLQGELGFGPSPSRI